MNRVGLDYVVIYICPNESCDNYYGSSSAGRLEEEKITAPSHAKDAGQFRHMRSRCPDCGSERQRKWAKILDPEDSEKIETALANLA